MVGETGKAEGLASPATLVDLTRVRVFESNLTRFYLTHASCAEAGAAQHAG